MKERNKKLKVMSILGTRPEIIRLSCVLSKMDKYFTHKIVFTQQSYDYEMSQIFFEELELRRPDYILNVTYTGTGAVTSLTLPTAQSVAGRTVIIKDAGYNANTNNITVDTEGAETINNGASVIISGDGDSVSVYSDGTNWHIF